MKNDDPFALPSLVKSEEILANNFVTFTRDLLVTQEDHQYYYYSLNLRPYTVSILALTEEGLLVLTKEYRHPTGQVILGCPGGLVDEGENTLEAAARELFEETGYKAKNFEIMGEVFGFPGITGQKTTLIRATGAYKAGKPSPEPSEFIHPFLVNIEDIASHIADNQVDSLLLSALFFHNHTKL